MQKAQGVTEADDIFALATEFVGELGPKYKDGINQFLDSDTAKKLKDIDPEDGVAGVTTALGMMFEHANTAKKEKVRDTIFEDK